MYLLRDQLLENGMTHRQFLKNLTENVSNIIRIKGPITPYLGNKVPQGDCLGMLLKVYTSRGPDAQGHTELSAGNLVVLVDVLIESNQYTLLVTAKRVEFLNSNEDLLQTS